MMTNFLEQNFENIALFYQFRNKNHWIYKKFLKKVDGARNLFKDDELQLNSCVLFCLLKDERVFFAIFG